MSHVIIIGAGITGLSTAWYLQQDGIQVTIVDRIGIAAGASWGNAGQINPAFTVPLPGPGQVRYAMRSALDRSSALMLPVTLDPSWWRFIMQFTAHCTSSRWHRAMKLLTELTSRSMDAFDELACGGAAPPLHRGTALLAPCSTERERTHLQQELDAVARYDETLDYDIADGDAFRASEPSLSTNVQTGLVVHGQSYLDPPTLLETLGESVRARGGEIREHVPILDITDRGAAVEVNTEDGAKLRADRAVVATGAWLTSLASKFGVRRPVQGGRGYSFSVQPEQDITHPVYLPGRKVVCTPLGDRFRVTGIMELRPPDRAPKPRAIQNMIRSAQPMFDGIDWSARRDEWCGSRPLTPDGLPLVGPTSSPRVFVTGGHGMWGVTHGPATSKLLADMIAGRKVPDWATQMDPQR